MPIDMKEIKNIIKNNMDEQPYDITCATCGNDLSHSTVVDSDLDLNVEVETCDICLDAKEKEIREELKEE